MAVTLAASRAGALCPISVLPSRGCPPRELPSRGCLWELHAGPVLSHFSGVQLCAALRMAAHQAPLSMAFSRQEYWDGLPYPPPGGFPNPGIKPASLTSLESASGFFTASATRQLWLPHIQLDCSIFLRLLPLPVTTMMNVQFCGPLKSKTCKCVI